MDILESKELVRTFKKFISTYDKNHQFTVTDLCIMHKEWFGSVYSWAGRYRQVNLTKGDFSFAAAHLLPGLMNDFERKYLAVYTPCRVSPKKEIIHALAIVHAELLLIHPFREGNGRLARMLASLMALQVELPPLEFDILKGKKKQEYFFAVQFGLNQNYELMEKLFGEVIEWTLRQRGQPYR